MYLFLDLDGVINCSDENIPLKYYRGSPIEAYCDHLVANINLVVKKYNMKIVISSAWRICKTFEYLCQILRSIGIKGDIIGVTDDIYDKNCDTVRGNQIDRYVVAHNINENDYIILDDDRDMLWKQKKNFLHVNAETGFDNFHVMRLDRMINKRKIGVLNG